MSEIKFKVHRDSIDLTLLPMPFYLLMPMMIYFQHHDFAQRTQVMRGQRKQTPRAFHDRQISLKVSLGSCVDRFSDFEGTSYDVQGLQPNRLPITDTILFYRLPKQECLGER